MQAFKPIELGDKEVFNRFLKQDPPRISELTFSNLFILKRPTRKYPGLYAAINQLFCREAWYAMRYINREQDMGVEGLRQAKESYCPDNMVNKYIIKPK